MKSRYESVFRRYGIREWGLGLLWGDRAIGWLPEMIDAVDDRYDIPVWDVGEIINAAREYFASR